MAQAHTHHSLSMELSIVAKGQEKTEAEFELKSQPLKTASPIDPRAKVTLLGGHLPSSGILTFGLKFKLL